MTTTNAPAERQMEQIIINLREEPERRRAGVTLTSPLQLRSLERND